MVIRASPMPAATGGDHRRDEGLDDVDRAHQIDVDHRTPVPVGEPVDGTPGRHPRDVHHHVHRGVAGVHVGGEVCDRVIVGDIQCTMLGDVGPQRPGLGNGSRQTLGVDVGQIEFGAHTGQS